MLYFRSLYPRLLYLMCFDTYFLFGFSHILHLQLFFMMKDLVDENNQVLRWLELIGSIWYAMHNRHITNTWWIRKCIFGSEVEIIQLTPILFLIQLLDISAIRIATNMILGNLYLWFFITWDHLIIFPHLYLNDYCHIAHGVTQNVSCV